MEAEGWPTIECDRLEGENLDAYRARSGQIAEIIEGFRMGRYRGDFADKMERRLIRLQEQALELELLSA